MSNGIKFLEGLAIGGFLGFLAGILSAPKSGKELRQELLSESEDLYKQATESVSDVKTKTNQAIAALQAKGEDLVKAASESFGKKEGSSESIPPNVN
jgi:gas vesicle protein